MSWTGPIDMCCRLTKTIGLSFGTTDTPPTKRAFFLLLFAFCALSPYPSELSPVEKRNETSAAIMFLTPQIRPPCQFRKTKPHRGAVTIDLVSASDSSNEGDRLLSRDLGHPSPPPSTVGVNIA
ncbi:hypothetical protein CDAR_600911 [Caerostris darwini]|uniref:Uncharacterized protein n=1 Tax=Caerostris darwini TaxID=1538125 RepID=A0AAV4TV83_9ARAC|nr:hypothetical protein CDAR_600911 [Caerostris darwini]